MERYLSIRSQTALYIAVFIISIHHVFVYLTNSSTLRFIFDLKTTEVLSIYGVSSLFGLSIYMFLLRNNLTKNVMRNIYSSAFLELLCLIFMYYFSIHQNIYIFIFLFMTHHMITPYILFNLDILFENFTNVADRGKSRGIYLTVWNIPFVMVPLILSTLSINNISIVYTVSATLLLPFMYILYSYIKNPDIIDNNTNNIIEEKRSVTKILSDFFRDKLDRKAFIIQSLSHLYYVILAVLLPIYLNKYFDFDWNKIGLIFAAMTIPFILIQIPMGNIEDKKHNEKIIFRVGIFILILFSILTLFINPNIGSDLSFILFVIFLFMAHIGSSLTEISTESLFYKHVNAKNHNALLMFRATRILPYIFGLIALFFI